MIVDMGYMASRIGVEFIVIYTAFFMARFQKA